MLTGNIVFLAFLAICLSLHASSRSTGVIAGSVMSASGEPVGAEINLYRLTAFDGAIRPIIECSTRVNDQGYFRCETLSAGTYFLFATLHPSSSDKESLNGPVGFVNSEKVPDVGARRNIPPIIVFPLLNSGLQNLIHLSDAGSESVAIQVPSAPMCTLKAKPALGFATGQVQLFAEGEGFSVRVHMEETTDPHDGDYLWDGIPPGTYKIVEDWSEEQDADRHYAVKAVSVDPSTQGEIDLANARTYKVAGRVEYTGRSPSSEKGVVLSSITENGLARYVANVQKDGLFALKDVAEGSYRISMPANASAKIEQITVAGKELSDPVIFVPAANSPISLVITAIPAKGIVSGMLQLDGWEAKPGVVIQSLDSQTAMAVPVQAGGFFQVTSIAPGPYRISGWADISKVPYDTPTFLAPYKDRSVDVEINESSPVMGLELHCIHAEL